MQGIGVHTAGQHLAGAWHGRVIGAAKTRNRVQQDNHVALVLNQSFRLLDHHFGDLNVACRRLIEGRGNNFALHRAAHVGHFFRPLIDQQHDQVAFRMVLFDRSRNILQQHGLTRPRRRNDQGALALADRRHDIDNAARPVFLRGIAAFHLHPLFGIKRGQVIEVDFLAGLFRLLEIDLRHVGQRKIALIVLRRRDRALNRVTGPDIRLFKHFRADIDVIRAGQIVGFRRAQEAEAIGQHFQNALARDLDFAIGQLFQDREQHVLRAQRRGVLDFKFLGIGQKFFRGFCFEFAEGDAGNVIEHG